MSGEGGFETPWGVDSEYGLLRDVLVCAPDNFRWLPTSMISRATLASGARFDPLAARGQHAEMVAAYESADVAVHFLTPDPELPYQVFTRDSSAMTASGAVITRPSQAWREGEAGPALRFYQEHGLPLRGTITAGTLEGGDVIVVEPGVALIGNGEERTEAAAAAQLGAWMRDDGWDARIESFEGRFVHLDVLVSILAPRLAAVCVEAMPRGLVAWLRGRGFETIEVSLEEALVLGVNAISLGADRVLSSAGAPINERLRALGIEVLDPDLSMFTAGGGGPHCLAQALRRERVG